MRRGGRVAELAGRARQWPRIRGEAGDLSRAATRPSLGLARPSKSNANKRSGRPIQEVWIQRQRFDLVKRRSMMRTIARRITACNLINELHDVMPHTSILDLRKCFREREAICRGHKIDRKSTRLNSSHRCISY